MYSNTVIRETCHGQSNCQKNVFMAHLQSNRFKFIRVIIETGEGKSGYALMPFRGKVPFLYWHCALFAPAPCPFEILAGALILNAEVVPFVYRNVEHDNLPICKFGNRAGRDDVTTGKPFPNLGECLGLYRCALIICKRK